jgi:DNA end-binding protein Ku
MARAIWSGAISFGLVNVPVKLYSATSPKTVRFNQISGKTGARIKQKRVDASTGEEVAFEDIVKGYELGPDRYVVIDPAELDALDPKATRTIDIEEFVDLEQIDPIYYDSSYYLAPSAGGAKAYRLLLEAMRDAGKVAIGRVVLRSKQQLCALRAGGEVLTLSTMLFGDEIVSPEALDELDTAAGTEASERELAMARQLIESLSSAFDPTRHRDEYRERVLALIEAKAAGEQLASPPAEAAPAPAPDLMAALEASLAAVRADAGTPEPAPPKRSPRTKRAAKAAGDDGDGDGRPAGRPAKRAAPAAEPAGRAVKPEP